MPVNRTLSLEQIDEALLHLNCRNTRSAKYKLLQSIRQCYNTATHSADIDRLDTDRLIPRIWDTGSDKSRIKFKRKNFNSLKSSLNSDLMKLFERGDNPDGIIIGPENTFVMSDKAKDRLLSTMTRAFDPAEGPISRIGHILENINEFLNKLDVQKSEQPDDEIRMFKDLIRKLSKQTGIIPDAGDGTPDLHQTTEALENDTVELVDVVEDAPDNEPDAGEDDFEIDDNEEPAENLDDFDYIDDEDIEDLDSEFVAEDDIADAGASEDDTVELVDVVEDAPDNVDESNDTSPEIGLAFNPLDDEHSRKEKNRLLAEAFDGYLGAMERYYNQYLLIPAGTYTVGSKYPRKDAGREQRLSLPNFYMGKFPVTNALFEVFVERTGYKTTAEELGFGIVYEGRFQKIHDHKSGQTRSTWNSTCRRKVVQGACWYQPDGPGSNFHKKRNHPVVQVSIKDAVTFAAWVGKRLPGESEWEAAARTSHGAVFPWGDNPEPSRCNIENAGVADTTPVDMYKQHENNLGICDTLGNVLEWTTDICQSPYPVRHAATYYIAKGGSWISNGSLDLTDRFRFEKNFTANILGFRCLADT